MSMRPVRAVREDPLHDWRVRGRPLSSLTDTAPSCEPPLVGREDLLGQFQRLAMGARSDDAVVLALSGEAGIGKTRLLREFARRAREENLDAGGVSGITHVWQSRKGVRPLVVFCDGVSAGTDVLSLVELGSHQTNSGVLIVIAVPSTEAEERDGRRLHTALAAAARRGSLVEASVPPLSEPELLELTRLLVGGQPGHELRLAISRLSEGNPYLAIQVILDLMRTGLVGEVGGTWELRRRLNPDFLPAPVASVTTHAIQGLDPAAAATLATAAAFGPGFQFDLLTTICRQPVEYVLEHLEVGLAHGIIREASEPPDDFYFAHELFRRTLYKQLNAIRRHHIHQRIATVLESGAVIADAEDRVAPLAHHVRRGVDRQRALGYTLRALARSEYLGAWDDAIRDCREALNLARRVDAGESVELNLLEHLAELYFGRAQPFAAGACWREALCLCESTGNLGRRAVVMARLAALGPAWQSIDEAQRAFAAAQADAARDAAAWQFDACLELGMANERHGRLGEAISYSRAAAAMVRGEDACAHGLALTNLANPLISSGRPAEAVEVLSLALELLDGQPPGSTDSVHLLEHLHDPRRTRCLALADLARALVFVGDIDRAFATAEWGCAEEDRVGMRGRSHRAIAQIELARGRPRAALEVLTREGSYRATELLGASRAADLMLLAEAHLAADEPTASLQTALDGIRICERSGAQEYLAGLYLAAGRVRLYRGDVTGALEAVSAAHATIEASGTLIFQPQLLQLEADICAARGVPGADVLRHKACSLARTMGLGSTGSYLPVPPPTDRKQRGALVKGGSNHRSLTVETPPRKLSLRELEVLSLVADGCTNRGIAEQLVVSDKTVKRHLSNILEKLGVGTRAAAVGQGLRLGLL